VSASEEDPRYLVESDKTGKRAAHKAEALERRSA
jgi:Hypervirulence associated proteins TUDOR domain